MPIPRRRLTLFLGAVDLAGALFALWTSVPASVTGVAVDAGYRPLAGAVAQVAAENGFTARSRTDSMGRFSLPAPRWPVGWNITVTAPGFLPAPWSGGRVVVHRLPALRGQAIDETGQPVAGAIVSVGADGSAPFITTTDQAGLFTIWSLPPGAATLSAAADGHDALQRQLTLSTDEIPVELVMLARQMGHLSITSNPAGQAVLVDGQPAPGCPQTPCEVDVPVGAHTVHIEGELYVPWEQAYSLVRGDQVPVAAELERKMGTLNVTAPAGGELSVDGQNVGGPTWTGQVPTGPHSAGFRSAGTWPAVGTASVTWKQTAGISLSPTPVVPGDTAAFLSSLRAYLSSVGGSYGVYLEELGSGRTIGLGQDQPMEAASVIKLPLALYLLHQVDAGQVKLEDPVQLQDGDFMGGTGTLYGNAHSGDQFSYGDLLGLLIQQSDNTAWQALDRVLDVTKVDAYAASVGAPDCHQLDDNCTAHEAGLLMAQLARGKLLTAASSNRLLQLLESTAFNDRINYYLGGTAVAHKVGMDGGVMNDVGVVYLQGDPFVVSVFTITPDATTGVQAIRDISRAAVRLYSK